MNNKWNMSKLKDVCINTSYGYTATTIKENTGVKFLRITDIVNDFVEWDNVPFCNISETLINNYKLEIGDLCIARTGNTVGANYVVDKNINAIYASYLVRFKMDFKKINPFYAKYIFKSNLWINYVNKMKVKSVQPGLNAKEMGKFEFPLPPLEEQEKIANLLSSLDNKIELNNQINKDLEEIAQTLYTKWFVNFDFPNEEGKPYKSSGGEMIDSELGEIPVGWNVGVLGDLFDFVNGFAFKSDSYIEDGDYRVITIKNVLQNKLSISNNDSRISVIPEQLKKSQFLNKGDILMSLTGEVGRVCLVDELNCLLNQRVSKVEIKSEKNHYYSYIYQLLSDKTIKSKISGIATGSIQQNVSTTNILKIKNIIPSEEILNKFNNICYSLIVQIIENNIMNKQLKEIRDLLLPYLMSGKIQL